MQRVAEAEENCQPFIHRSDLGARKFAEHTPDPPLIDGSKMIDKREMILREAGLSGRK
jgi:hypothetical protein